MRSDYLGNPVSAAGAATTAAIDDFVGGLLAYETRAERVGEAADRDPGGCLVNAYAGMLWMLLEAPEAPARAVRYLAAAERAAGGATPREQSNVAFLRAWVADDMPLALRLCDRITDEYPRDLAIVKLHQYLEFNRGNSPQMLRAALKVMDRNADVPQMHGMAAFAFEQCHLLDAAEREARTAMALLPREPWAQHALAHVLLTRGSVDAGADFLESVADGWTGLNSFMSTHLWWHLALFYLSQGRDARVLELYDAKVWGVAKNYSQDQIGAVSLLARAELAGIDVGARWQDLASHLAARADDTTQPFLTMQYLYGLARAGRAEAAQLLAAVRRQAAAAPDHAREVWKSVTLPACEGLYAHAHGRFEDAWRQLGSVLPRLVETGGSHAQRDLFELLRLDAARRCGYWAAAQHLLEPRRSVEPDGVPVNAALAEVYARLNLPALAAEARARASASRERHDRARNSGESHARAAD